MRATATRTRARPGLGARLERDLFGGATRTGAVLDRAARDPRVLAGLVALYALAWTIVGDAVFGRLPMQGDMAENFAWSRDLELGYFKHPPLLPFVVAGWFALFPVSVTAYHALAGVNAALGIAALYGLGLVLFDRRRALIAASLVALPPVFSVHALTLNHNTILLSLWPAIALAWALAVGRGGLRYAALAGLAAAAGMLAKYFTVYLLLSLALLTLATPEGRRWLLSPMPFVTTAVALAAFAPHGLWLLTTELPSYASPLVEYRVEGIGALLRHTLHFLGAAAGFALIPLAGLLAAARSPAALIAAVRPAPGFGARTARGLFLLPILLPIATLAPAMLRVHTPWLYPVLGFAPLALVVLPGVAVTRVTAARALGLAVIVTLLAVLASPLIGRITDASARRAAEPIPDLAAEVTRVWRSGTGTRLGIVSGDIQIAHMIAFHSPDHPSVFRHFDRRASPWITPERIDRQGFLAVCRDDDADCRALVARAMPGAAGATIVLDGTGPARGRVFVYEVSYFPPARR